MGHTTRGVWLPIFLWFVYYSAPWLTVFPSSQYETQSLCGTGMLPGQTACGCWFSIQMHELVGGCSLSLGAHFLLLTVFGENWGPWASVSVSNWKLISWLQRLLGDTGLRTQKLHDCVCFISFGSWESKHFHFFFFFFIKLSLRQKIRCSSKRIVWLYSINFQNMWTNQSKCHTNW